jgi:hypothetical protein
MPASPKAPKTAVAKASTSKKIATASGKKSIFGAPAGAEPKKESVAREAAVESDAEAAAPAAAPTAAVEKNE